MLQATGSDRRLFELMAEFGFAPNRIGRFGRLASTSAHELAGVGLCDLAFLRRPGA